MVLADGGGGGFVVAGVWGMKKGADKWSAPFFLFLFFRLPKIRVGAKFPKSKV